VIAFKKYAKE